MAHPGARRRLTRSRTNQEREELHVVHHPRGEITRPDSKCFQTHVKADRDLHSTLNSHTDESVNPQEARVIKPHATLPVFTAELFLGLWRACVLSVLIVPLFWLSKIRDKHPFLKVFLAATTRAPACFDDSMLISCCMSGCSFRKRGEPN